MDIRIPLALRAKIPQLGEASEEADPMVWVKLTCEQAGWTWYIIEMQPQHLDAIFYGYRVGWDEEVTYFNQSDLELSSAQWGFPIVRDEAFTPCRLSAVQTAEHGVRKFPLGQLVATPGAVEALARNGHGATWMRKTERRMNSPSPAAFGSCPPTPSRTVRAFG